MEELKEMIEYTLAHREEGYEGHKIVNNLMNEFKHLMKTDTGEYYGIQLSGKVAIYITYYSTKHNFRTETQISL